MKFEYTIVINIKGNTTKNKPNNGVKFEHTIVINIKGNTTKNKQAMV